MVQSLAYTLTRTDPISIALRESLELPHLPSANQISLVDTERLCAEAAEALDRVEGVRRNRQVYVLGLGSTHYAVYDPAEAHSGSDAIWVSYFDRKFEYLSTGGL